MKHKHVTHLYVAGCPSGKEAIVDLDQRGDKCRLKCRGCGKKSAVFLPGGEIDRAGLELLDDACKAMHPVLV